MQEGCKYIVIVRFAVKCLRVCNNAECFKKSILVTLQEKLWLNYAP